MRLDRGCKQYSVRDVLQHCGVVAGRRRQLGARRALPRALAGELLLCGERISATRLHELGIINRVCGPGNALTEALSLATRVNALAPNALASIKELLNDAATNSLSEQLASERDHFVRNLHHANGAEGVGAFLEKRKPKFR